MSAPRVILIEYFTSPEGVILFLAGADFPQPEVIRLSTPVEELRQFAVQHFGSLDAVRRLTPTALKRWQELFAPLVAPVTRYAAPGDTVWLVPHDVLHRLPLRALLVEGVPLIERNPVCYSPSATVMKYCQAKRKGRREKAFIVGDSRRDLPDARAEALAVADLFGTTALLGEEANRERVRAALDDPDGRFDVIHFACHGRLNPQNAWQSGLALAGTGTDATLTAEEILGLRFRADLVTLSACESGVNEHRPGDELLGLTRALIFAGTPSVVVSLWAVHDLSTRLLMERFYQELLRKDGEAGPATKAQALRTAQLAVRDLTGEGLKEWCDRRATLASGLSPQTRTRLEADQKLARELAGDTQRHLGARPEPEDTEESRRPDGRPFEQLYHWAPFVLVGDWR
jgi:CHAT domain-containing protein